MSSAHAGPSEPPPFGSPGSQDRGCCDSHRAVFQLKMTLPPFLACLAAGCCQVRGASWPNSVQLSCICDNNAEQSACRGRIHSSHPIPSHALITSASCSSPVGCSQPPRPTPAPHVPPCSSCTSPGLSGCVTSPLRTHSCARAAPSCRAPCFGDSHALAQWHQKGPSIRILGRLSPSWGGRWCFCGGLHGQRAVILLHGGAGAKQGDMNQASHPCALTPSP